MRLGILDATRDVVFVFVDFVAFFEASVAWLFLIYVDYVPVLENECSARSGEG